METESEQAALYNKWLWGCLPALSHSCEKDEIISEAMALPNSEAYRHRRLYFFLALTGRCSHHRYHHHHHHRHWCLLGRYCYQSIHNALAVAKSKNKPGWISNVQKEASHSYLLLLLGCGFLLLACSRFHFGDAALLSGTLGLELLGYRGHKIISLEGRNHKQTIKRKAF